MPLPSAVLTGGLWLLSGWVAAGYTTSCSYTADVLSAALDGVGDVELVAAEAQCVLDGGGFVLGELFSPLGYRSQPLQGLPKVATGHGGQSCHMSCNDALAHTDDRCNNSWHLGRFW